MSSLDKILAFQGYAHRPQQDALYERLLGIDTDGVVVQAGTGTGKSIGVLAAAADWQAITGKPTLVITPTKALQDQYMRADGPAVEAALGLKVRVLKGRGNYACASADAWMDGVDDSGDGLPRWIADQMEVQREVLYGDGPHFVTRDADWFGCPGSEDCDRSLCHYSNAHDDLDDADIIVTNTTMWIIDRQMVQRGVENAEGKIVRIFPPYGALLVDEAHALEGSIRDFGSSAISEKVLEDLLMGAGKDLAALLHRANTRDAKAMRLPAAPARPSLERVSNATPAIDGKGRPKRTHKNAIDAADKMLNAIDKGWYDSSDMVLWFDPAEEPKSPRLVSSMVNVAGMGRSLLKTQPFALVSATVPQSMPSALGVPEVGYLDVGHPFDYARQATIAFSGWSGAAAVAADTRDFRVEEVYNQIMASGGGALVLFSAFSDLQYVHDALVGRLQRNGLTVLKQDRDSDKAWLGARFKEDGNAVLFGSDTFATGFDCPGTALRNVIIWKAPYPALDPVNRAIQSKGFKRYEDMMLMKVTQAIGRLIRTSSDTGSVFIADSRLRPKLRNPRDPMTAHLKDFALVEAR